MLVKLYIRAAHSGRSCKTKTTMCVSLYTQKGMLFSVNSEELATTKKKKFLAVTLLFKSASTHAQTLVPPPEFHFFGMSVCIYGNGGVHRLLYPVIGFPSCQSEGEQLCGQIDKS